MSRYFQYNKLGGPPWVELQLILPVIREDSCPGEVNRLGADLLSQLEAGKSQNRSEIPLLGMISMTRPSYGCPWKGFSWVFTGVAVLTMQLVGPLKSPRLSLSQIAASAWRARWCRWLKGWASRNLGPFERAAFASKKNKTTRTRRKQTQIDHWKCIKMWLVKPIAGFDLPSSLVKEPQLVWRWRSQLPQEQSKDRNRGCQGGWSNGSFCFGLSKSFCHRECLEVTWFRHVQLLVIGLPISESKKGMSELRRTLKRFLIWSAWVAPHRLCLASFPAHEKPSWAPGGRVSPMPRRQRIAGRFPNDKIDAVLYSKIKRVQPTYVYPKKLY